MDIRELTPPVQRRFTLEVNADELAVIENGLLRGSSATAKGAAKNYEVWSDVNSFMDTQDIDRISEE